MTINFRWVFVLFCLLLSVSAYAFNGFDLSRLGGSDPAEELLPEDQAFQILETRLEGDEVVITWVSSPEYYLYKKNFKLVSQTEGVTFGALELPKGETEEDPLFGSVEVYFGEVEIRAKVIRSAPFVESLAFINHAQGCNKPVGICYPPQKRDGFVSLASFPDASVSELSAKSDITRTNDDLSAASSQLNVVTKTSYWTYILSAFAVGLLLVFTPCVLPMLPILSGLIVGLSSGSNEEESGKMRAGILSISYVLGTAVTYTAMGIAAGAAGVQLQAYFQNPIAIIFMVSVLSLLALAMFGLFDIALPSSAQSRITNITNRLKGGSIPVAFLVGLLSALIVSACVSPLLITALGAAIREGDPMLGGVMMFSLAMGMGVFLVAFGMGAGWMVPRVGGWMNHIKTLFGFMILAVAIIVLSGLSWVPILFLWAVLFALFGFWLWSIQVGSFWPIIFRALAFLSLLWSGSAFFGGITGGQDITKPLSSFSVKPGSKSGQSVKFEKVYTAVALERAVQKAKLSGKPVLIDYYADWCTDCKRMDRSTYQAVEVIDALDSWVRIKVDVTDQNSSTQQAKSAYGVFGPPATLFINDEGEELKQLRRYGYIEKKDMLDLINMTRR